ncbi:LacI family transcriptional regulator [Photobacterium jeanii]|uniref:LacI family transcriptional regulator n=1 Tax=Photobacterium jeanii TaxID=858640 RepID=A0A178K230_9GAMM|nr:LacI family DNA-binding transcriptional regulator [Photobacterium jeanii]OAN11389.1 LacI family transcriptional regulator [Photobacterium jeanii]PST90910.1 LacI family transcriptional regulator [Photobacterium jeanii]
MTIRDVARKAGVSIATVSRVINGSERISPQAKHAVEQAIEQLNYQKPPAKRKKPTKLFAVIVRNMTNPFFTQLVDVLEEEAYKHGRSILLFNSRNNLQLEKTFLTECVNHRVDGVFLIPRSLREEHLKTVKQLPFPVVLLTATSEQMLSVGTHHQHGGELAAQHFLNQGFRRMGFIGSSDKHSDRLLGFKKALTKQNIILEKSLVLAPYTSESLSQFIQQHISTPQSPIEGIFCSDDIAASHLHNALNLHNNVIEHYNSQPPLQGKIEIIGFDDTFIAQSLGFSSIKQPMRQIALLGFEMMIETIAGQNIANQQVLLEPSLVIRHTPTSLSGSRSPEILRT